MTKRKFYAAVAATMTLCALSACGSQTELAEARPIPLDETAETVVVLTENTTEQETKSLAKLTTTRLSAKATTEATEPATTTEAIAEAPTAAEEEFVLSDTEVADKMYAFFSDKGYNEAQIAGIVGNAEVESGLEPSRSIDGGYFGLFQLRDCEQRREMMAAFEAEGVGKYACPEYWGRDASGFDSREDFDAFMDVQLSYTMDQDDSTWMEELYAAESPEEAAEVFLVHYERAINGTSPVEYYAPYSGLYYQGTESRREAARRWYEHFISA